LKKFLKFDDVYGIMEGEIIQGLEKYEAESEIAEALRQKYKIVRFGVLLKNIRKDELNTNIIALQIEHLFNKEKEIGKIDSLEIDKVFAEVSKDRIILEIELDNKLVSFDDLLELLKNSKEENKQRFYDVEIETTKRYIHLEYTYNRMFDYYYYSAFISKRKSNEYYFVDVKFNIIEFLKDVVRNEKIKKVKIKRVLVIEN